MTKENIVFLLPKDLGVQFIVPGICELRNLIKEFGFFPPAQTEHFFFFFWIGSRIYCLALGDGHTVETFMSRELVICPEGHNWACI